MKKRGIPKPYVSIQIIKNAFNFKDVIKIIMIFLSANQIKNDIKNRFLEKKNSYYTSTMNILNPAKSLYYRLLLHTYSYAV